jgi:hypothetical protein
LQRDKRITIAKDVDYYTGKLEELQAKGDKVGVWLCCGPTHRIVLDHVFQSNTTMVA